MYQLEQVSGSGFLGMDIILPSQLRDRIARLDAGICALWEAIDRALKAENRQTFVDRFNVTEYGAWVHRWATFKDNLTWSDVNINTVGTWDTVGVYEAEFEAWRKMAADCGAKGVPKPIPKLPEGKRTLTDVKTTAIILIALGFVASRVIR